MTTYHVSWEIMIEADTPVEAAEKARALQLDKFSTELAFRVEDTGDSWAVYLTPPYNEFRSC